MLEPLMFCLWLIPSEPAYSQLSNQITTLSQKYKAPVFEPHMTLFCGKTTNKQQLIADVQKIASRASPLTLQVTGVNAGPDYFKSVYVTMSSSLELEALFQKVAMLDPQSHYALKSHASLLYQEMPLSQKQDIALHAQSSLKLTTLTFDQIQLTSDTDQIGPEAVKSWKIWYKGPLGSSHS